MNWRQAAVDFLFPPKCPFCRRVTEGARVCPRCGKVLPWTEGKDREQTLAGGLRCVSPLWYEDLARDGILRFKFHGGAGAETLGSLLADCAAERCSGEFDLVTWVPVSRRRRRKRGYDQAALLCRALGARLGLEPVQTLRKIKDPPAQSTLAGAEQRRANVSGAYRAEQPERFAGKRVLIIDDIVTTGATLAECSRTLLQAGASDVVYAAFAAPRKQD